MTFIYCSGNSAGAQFIGRYILLGGGYEKCFKCYICKEEIPAGMCSSRDFLLVFLYEFFYHFKDPLVTFAGKVLQIVGRGVVVFVEFPF